MDQPAEGPETLAARRERLDNLDAALAAAMGLSPDQATTPERGAQRPPDAPTQPELAPLPEAEASNANAPRPHWDSNADQKATARAIGDSIGSVPTSDTNTSADPGPVPDDDEPGAAGFGDLHGGDPGGG